MSTAMRTSVVLSALGIVLLVTAAPAAAHTALIGTAPEADATVTEELSHVVLEFNESVNQTIAEVAVQAPDGTPVADGDPHIDGARVSQQLEALAQTGAYTVSYRVVASDGHPLTGTFDFVYDGPTATTEAEPTPTPDATEPEAPDPTPEATEPEAPDPTPDATEPDATEPEDETAGRAPGEDETEMAAPPAGGDDGTAQEAAAVTADPVPLLLLATALAALLLLLVAATRAVRILARWEPVQ